MDKLKQFLTNSIEYNLGVLKKANKFLEGYEKPPENKGEMQTVMIVGQDTGKRIVRLSELVRIYEEGFEEKYNGIPDDIREQITIIREDFLHLKGEDLIVPSGITLQETISEIVKKESTNERDSTKSEP